MKSPWLTAVGAAFLLVASPSAVCAWTIHTLDDTVGDELYIAVEAGLTPGYGLYIACYSPVHAFEFGIRTPEAWDPSAERPWRVNVGFTINGHSFEESDFRFVEEQGNAAVAVSFHSSPETFAYVVAAISAAEGFVDVEFLGNRLRFGLEGAREATAFLLERCG